MSNVQDYIEYIIKRHETLTTIPPIYVYIKRISNRLVFNYLAAQKKLIVRTNNGENAPSLEVVEVFLVQCNLVDNEYQQKSEILYTLMPNKSYTYLLHVQASNSVFVKRYNTDFDETIITFTDQNGRPLEIDDRVNLKLLINK